jgi:hypothetical protein
MHFFFSLSFSFGLAHSLFLFPLSPFPPTRPSPAGLFLFLFIHSCAAQPAQSSVPPLLSLLSLAVRRAPSVVLVSYLELDSGSLPSPTATSRAALSPHIEAPRPPYKAATPRPRSCQSRNRRLASQTLAVRVRCRRTSAVVAVAASPLPCCHELPPEFRLGVRVLASLLSPLLSPFDCDVCSPSPPCRASPPCGRTNLNYTGSSTRVHFQGLQRASNGIIPWPVR